MKLASTPLELGILTEALSTFKAKIDQTTQDISKALVEFDMETKDLTIKGPIWQNILSSKNQASVASMELLSVSVELERILGKKSTAGTKKASMDAFFLKLLKTLYPILKLFLFKFPVQILIIMRAVKSIMEKMEGKKAAIQGDDSMSQDKLQRVIDLHLGKRVAAKAIRTAAARSAGSGGNKVNIEDTQFWAVENEHIVRSFDRKEMEAMIND